jgi:hypothetical protein
VSDKTPGKPKSVQVQIQVDDDVAQGVYSNFALVSHTDAEFTLDFAYLQPQAPRAKVRARVITSPKHVKRLILALQDNLAKYEAAHGTIEAASQIPPNEFRH